MDLLAVVVHVEVKFRDVVIMGYQVGLGLNLFLHKIDLLDMLATRIENAACERSSYILRVAFATT